MNGFHTEKEPYKLQKKRLEASKRIVKKENPDILCLCEANFAGPNPFNIKMDYQKIFGYRYVYFASRKRQFGNMILSNYPMDKVYSFSDERFICLRAKFIIKGEDLYLDIVHPSPRLKSKDAIRYMASVLNDKKDNYILTGDFNALSDEDKYDIKKIKRLMKRIDPEKTLKSLLDRRLLSWLGKQKLIDVMKKFEGGFTMPTDLIDKKKESPLRIDYFFASKKIKIKDAKVIRGKDTEMASDHYPIAMEIEI